ncbi:MAG: hypothetical protein ABIL86_06540, partial [candidate division WOR-3 bacterium]
VMVLLTHGSEILNTIAHLNQKILRKYSALMPIIAQGASSGWYRYVGCYTTQFNRNWIDKRVFR